VTLVSPDPLRAGDLVRATVTGSEGVDLTARAVAAPPARAPVPAGSR
jgi:hypothetical protein